jgi:hypothetical protein
MLAAYLKAGSAYLTSGGLSPLNGIHDTANSRAKQYPFYQQRKWNTLFGTNRRE